MRRCSGGFGGGLGSTTDAAQRLAQVPRLSGKNTHSLSLSSPYTLCFRGPCLVEWRCDQLLIEGAVAEFLFPRNASSVAPVNDTKKPILPGLASLCIKRGIGRKQPGNPRPVAQSTGYLCLLTWLESCRQEEKRFRYPSTRSRPWLASSVQLKSYPNKG